MISLQLLLQILTKKSNLKHLPLIESRSTTKGNTMTSISSVSTQSLSKPKILIVEDDIKLSQLLAEFLSSNDFIVDCEGNGKEAVDCILKGEYDAIILDWMLPGMNGLEICKTVRNEYQGAIMMLTAKRSDIDQVIGLEIGTDDYITKPVEPYVLLARIRSQLRLRKRLLETHPTSASPNAINAHLQEFAYIQIDLQAREVWIKKQSIFFTSAEFDLLYFLCQRMGEVVSREEIYQKVKGIEYDGLDRSVDIHISKIRHKIKEAGIEYESIKSIRGSGYLMVKKD
jgi:two-component system response regulator RstA